MTDTERKSADILKFPARAKPRAVEDLPPPHVKALCNAYGLWWGGILDQLRDAKETK